MTHETPLPRVQFHLLPKIGDVGGSCAHAVRLSSTFTSTEVDTHMSTAG